MQSDFYRSLALLIVATTACIGSEIAVADERPNILFIMSDDHTAQAIGAYATLLEPLDPTPTIDRLAAEGICFDIAFCTNSICTPSRACIITGKNNHNNGVFDLGARKVFWATPSSSIQEIKNFGTTMTRIERKPLESLAIVESGERRS